MTDLTLIREHGSSSGVDGGGAARDSAAVDYWTTILADAHHEIELLTDRSRPAIASKHAAVVVTTVPSELAARIIGIGTNRNCLPFVTLLAAFFTLLQRSTGQNDLLVGAPVASRGWPQGNSATRSGAGALPVRIQTTADETFASLLSKVDAGIVGMLAHADVPVDLALLQKDAGREPVSSPLFNVAFDFDSTPTAALTPGDDGRDVNIGASLSGLDLKAALRSEADGSLTCRFAYSTDLFDRESIELLGVHFRVLLKSIAEDVNTAIARLALADEAELDIIADTWSRSDSRLAIPPPGGDARTIHELVAFNAAHHPDRTALIEDGCESISYGELDRRANSLAHALRARGVKRDVRVGLYLERSISAVIAMFATLKAGGAYVPLDPDYPPERIAYMVESAGIEAIVASQRSFATLAAYSSMLVDIDDPAILLNPCERPLTGSDDPDSLAYVLFTSGSTGKPKAVAVPHRGVVALVTHPPFLASKPSDTVLLQGTLNFDLSVQMIWAPLIFGARLAIMPTGAFSSAEFVAQLTKYRVTGLFAATPLFHQLVEERLDDLRLLRCCIVAGDVLSPIHSGRFASEITGCRLFNGYGPTEATVIASVHEVLPDAAVRRSVPIGRPCAETRLYILDEMQKPVAIGVPGELWIGGSGVARGYLNDLALSQERFVRDPFSTDPCARLYRSGDRARWLPGGEIEFLGRADAQLKIRGFRIEPAEVEFALLDHPMVRHAAVVARGDASNLALIGYAEVRDARLTEADLRAFLQMKLPPHAIPSRLILVDSLPKTASGKIDRRGLPEPSARPVLTDAVVPAGDELQQSLIRLWEELLEVHPVGIRDDFFALGGHSLLAARLVREIERLFCVRLPLAILFERATVEQLADAMRLDAANLNQSPIVTFNTAGTKQPFFYLHGSLAGGGYYCSALAKYLGADRPVFAMRPHGVDGSPIPPTIEDIAAECIIALKSVLPQGPYLLGGWSGAGLVAFEMACQLAARGERVDNVLMIDASHAGRLLRAIVEFGEGMGRRMRISSARGAGLRKTVARLAYHFARFRAARDKRKYLELTVNRLRTAMDPHRLRKRAEATSRASAGTGELQHAWEWISDAYVPRRYAGRLTVLMPEEEPQSIVDAQGWLSVTARIDIRSVPGDHLSCITEHIEATAEQMADSMRF